MNLNCYYQEIKKEKYSVLIANDEEMQLYVLKVLFTKMNFDVQTARNGFEAFQMVVESHKSREFFDLIVLDLGMPISDGYEACMNML